MIITFALILLGSSRLFWLENEHFSSFGVSGTFSASASESAIDEQSIEYDWASSPSPESPLSLPLEDTLAGLAGYPEDAKNVIMNELRVNDIDVDMDVISLSPSWNSSSLSDDENANRSVEEGEDFYNESWPRKRPFRPHYPLRRDPLLVVIPVTIIYALTLIIGLVGNISTCVVIAKNNYMHTATNYYLFSLAVSDLLLLISGLPQEMYLTWFKWPYQGGEAFCLIRGLAAETSANATVLTITAFTFERYVAICHPLRSHKLSQLSRVIRLVLAIWILALTLALPQAAQFGVIDEVQNNQVVIPGAWCTIKRTIIPYAFQISICVFFVIPMTIITALYVLIGLKLRRTRGPNRTNHELTVEPRNTNRHSQSHVIRMLVAVVIAFFLCWCPFHIQRLMAIYSEYLGIATSPFLGTLYKVINYVSGILYYVSTCINPILYHIMSNKFRQAFKDTMSQLFGRPPSRVQHRSYSAISHRSSRMAFHHHLHHTNHYGSRRGEHQETCINCRHPPTHCSCRGNSQKYVRTYNLEQTGSDTTTVSLLSTSPPSEKPEPTVVALASQDIRKGPVCEAPRYIKQSEQSQPSSGLSAWLCSRGRIRRSQNTSNNSRPEQPPKEMLKQRRNDGTASQSPPTVISLHKGRKKDIGDNDKDKKNCVVKITPGEKNTATSNKMMFILMKKRRKPAKNVGGVRSLSTGGIIPGAEIIGPKKECCRAMSQTSVDSNNTNTISNSSLQDLDESEYTGEELAGVLAELKAESMESPKRI